MHRVPSVYSGYGQAMRQLNEQTTRTTNSYPPTTLGPNTLATMLLGVLPSNNPYKNPNCTTSQKYDVTLICPLHHLPCIAFATPSPPTWINHASYFILLRLLRIRRTNYGLRNIHHRRFHPGLGSRHSRPDNVTSYLLSPFCFTHHGG